ncbi:RNA-binding protein [Sporolactobacillus sp. THM7-7]|nr:RNA-binding protein [Sporolactobacillus sp. THM7-7]
MSIYEHFRPEERSLIDRILDWKDQAATRYVMKRTDFLDPRGQAIIRSLIGNEDEVGLVFSGGYPHAERKRALILPPYTEAADRDFKLAFFEVNYPSRFKTLTHRELLGALTGTGITRDKIGDLIFAGDRVQFVAAEEMESYLLLNVTSVGRTSVSCRTIDRASLIHNEEDWQEAEGTVSSLRLDTVLSEIHHLSRSKTAEMIAQGHAKVNWRVAGKKDEDLREGDTLSLRGYGRSKIISVEGITKKNKIRLRYGKLR